MKETLYSFLLVTVSVTVFSSLAPAGKHWRAYRSLCSIVISLALLSPLISLIRSAMQEEAPNTSPDSSGVQISAQERAQKFRVQLLERQIERLSSNHFGVDGCIAILDVSFQEEDTIYLYGAEIQIPYAVSAQEKSAWETTMKNELHCEVKVVVRE